METKLTALDVARCILAIADDDDQIDHLKLQKLCYYAQGMHLAIFGTPLFPDTLLRWRHGPVARSVWNAYKYAGSQPLQRPAAEEIPELPGAMQLFLRSVYEEYGRFSSWKLRDMTHQEPPYLEALAAGKQRLSTETMRSYFSGLLAARSGGENSAPPVRSVVRDIVESSPELADAVARGRADFASGAFERLR